MPISILRPISRESLSVIEIEEEDSIDEAMMIHDREIIEIAYREKMVHPIHIVSLASNGACFLVRSEGENKEGTALVEHEPEGGWPLPVHTLLLDAEGRTARVIMREHKES